MVGLTNQITKKEEGRGDLTSRCGPSAPRAEMEPIRRRFTFIPLQRTFKLAQWLVHFKREVKLMM